MLWALMATILIGTAMGDLSPDLSSEVNQHLDTLIEENILFEYEEIDSESISNVVDASFVKVKIIQLFDKNCHSKEECGYIERVVLESGDSITELGSTSELVPYLVPGFQLNDQGDAESFEKMLDLLFPVFFSSDQEIYQENNTWVFIREESFGEKNGVIALVDEQGKILSLNDEDGIERNNMSDESGEVER